jgi:cell division protein FtsQ
MKIFKNKISLPKLPDFRPWLFGVSVLAIGYMVFLAAQTKKLETIQKTNVIMIDQGQSEQMIMDFEVIKLLKIGFGTDFTGLTLSDVFLSEIEEVLLESPYISTCNASIDAKVNLNIQVGQKTPELRIQNGAKGYYLDRDGNRIPLSKHYSAQVLLAKGHLPSISDTSDAAKNRNLEALYQVNKWISINPVLSAISSHLEIDSDGTISIIPIAGPERIIIGSTDNIVEKLEKLLVFYQDPEKFKHWADYRKIDLRFEKQIVCQKRNIERS